MPRKRRTSNLVARNLTLAETHQEKLNFWDYKRNKISPQNLTFGSSNVVWWICPQDPSHHWQQKIYDFCKRQNDCMFCATEKIEAKRSLAGRYPELAKEWHPTRNGSLRADKIRPDIFKKIWWQCQENDDHQWAAYLTDRTGREKTGCPFCAGLRPCKSNNLAKAFPEIAKQWHKKLNGTLKPKDVYHGSSSKVWWQCTLFKDHAWQTSVGQRTRNKTGCPKCVALRTPPEKSLQKLFPKIAKQWHKEKNAPVTPLMVNSKSLKQYWWICGKNKNHVYLASVYNRAHLLTGCRYCSNQLITKENSLATDNPKLAKEWHKTLNGTLKPSQIAPNSAKKVWWQCPRGEDHVWQVSPCSRQQYKSGCPFCSNRRFSKTQSLQFQYPEIARQWHSKRNGKLKPDQLKPSDDRCVWWQCDRNPNHEWQSKIMVRVKAMAPCPICYRSRVYPGNSLAEKYPKVAEEWHPFRNKKLTPHDVSGRSCKKVFWRCRKNQEHVWEALVVSRTGMNSGCPHCWKQSALAAD